MANPPMGADVASAHGVMCHGEKLITVHLLIRLEETLLFKQFEPEFELD